MIPAYLERLDQKQKEAVVSKAKYLQILAGPGSGKTRVLTSRIAYLVKEKNIPPNNIFVATFTKKASLEMRERLNNEELLGPTVSVQLNMGTFHSLCAYYLRQHAALVKLPNNFRIIDNQESIKILEQVIKERMGSISVDTRSRMKSVKGLAGECQTKISKAKNKGFTAETYALLHESSMHPGDHDGIMIFWAYDQRLSLEHLVDFDDLLLYGRALFEGFPEVMAHVNHVLVDEFQDTNNVQYDIVNYLCNKRKHLTIVGDPDQSIYGFRNANVANFRLMQQDFEGTMVIQLEQNYRSTSSILDGAFQVIQKDTERIDKGLYTRNSAGTPLSLLNCKTEQDEGRVIADEIIRTIEYSHGLIQYKDIAVLVRMHYLTQNMESVFNKSKIPYEIIGGVRFFERVEVRDLTAYIHFIYNTNDTISFERIINIPLRGVGQILSDKISTLSRVQDKTVLDILDHFCSENCRPGKYQLAGYTVSEKVMDHLRDFVGLCAHVKIMMDKKESVEAILKEVIDRTLYEDHLKKTYKDHEIRWENVGELISVAHSHDTNMDAFISRTTLEPDLDNTSQNDKVKIMTIHAAKGLEWPCVFIAACEDNIIPHPKSENENEERRLMYVAMTRAKCFLYCSYVCKRLVWAEPQPATLSIFLSELSKTLYQRRTPAWNKESRAWAASLLKLPAPSEEEDKDHPGDEFIDMKFAELQMIMAGIKRDRDYDDEFDDIAYLSDFEIGYDCDFGISDDDSKTK